MIGRLFIIEGQMPDLSHPEVPHAVRHEMEYQKRDRFPVSPGPEAEKQDEKRHGKHFLAKKKEAKQE